MKLKVCLIIILHFVLDFLAIVLLGSAIGNHSHGFHLGFAAIFAVVCSIVFFHKHKSKDNDED